MLLLRAAGTGGDGGFATYAVDVEDAREIIPMRRMTRLPGAPPHVLGLINVRGMIVTVIDLARRLEPQAPAASVSEGAILLVRRGQGGGLVGLAVREVLDVRQVDLSDVENSILSMGAVRGVIHLGDTPVVVLDLHVLIKQVLLA
jgi:purine-binding chemotaxis protein CheW